MYSRRHCVFHIFIPRQYVLPVYVLCQGTNKNCPRCLVVLDLTWDVQQCANDKVTYANKIAASSLGAHKELPLESHNLYPYARDFGADPLVSFYRLQSCTFKLCGWFLVQLGIWRVPNIPNPMLGPQEFKLSSCVSVQACPTKLGSCFARSGLRGTPFPEDGFTQLICFRIPKKKKANMQDEFHIPKTHGLKPLQRE